MSGLYPLLMVLLRGVVLCDLKQSYKFSSVTSPTYDVDSNKYTYSCAKEFRSMAYVDGEIKFRRPG